MVEDNTSMENSIQYILNKGQLKNEMIPLVSYEFSYEGDEVGTLELTMEGIEFINSIKYNKFSILTIIGFSDVEKNILINYLSKLSKNELQFTQENTFPKDKKGIFIWGNPIVLKNGSILLVLDAGSFFKNSNCKNYDRNIFNVCLSLSSYILYSGSKSTAAEIIDNVDKLLQEVYQNYISKSHKLSLNNFTFLFKTENLSTSSITTSSCSSELISSKIKQFSINNQEFLLNTNHFIIPPINKDIDYLNDKELMSKENEVNDSMISTIMPKEINHCYLSCEIIFGLFQAVIACINKNENIDLYTCFENTIESSLIDTSDQINMNATIASNKKPKNSNNDFMNSNEEEEEQKNIFENGKDLFTNVLDDQLNKLAATPIGINLNLKCILQSFKSIINNLVDNFEHEYTFSRDAYNNLIDENIKKAKAKIDNGEFNKIKIDNIEEFLNNFELNLEDIFNGVFNFPTFNIKSKINELFKTCVIDSLTSINNDISSQIENLIQQNNEMKNLVKNTKEQCDEKIKEKDEELLNVRVENEKLDRKIKEKELEYLNLLNIERNKYTQLEKNYKEEIAEKEKLISELNKIIEENSLHLGKSSSNNKNNINIDLKNEYDQIIKTFIEFKTAVNLLESNSNILVQNVFVNKTVTQLDNKYKMLLENDVKYKSDIKEIIDNKLSFLGNENKKLKEELLSQKKISNFYKDKFETSFKYLEEISITLETNHKNYSEMIKQFASNSDSLKKKNMEIHRLKEEADKDSEELLNIKNSIECLLDENKQKDYETYANSLDNTFKPLIHKLAKYLKIYI